MYKCCKKYDHRNACSVTTVQRRKLQYFGRVVRARNLCIEILERRLDGKRKRGRPRRLDWINVPLDILGQFGDSGVTAASARIVPAVRAHSVCGVECVRDHC